LLALAGASAYFLGGAVVYTAASRAALLDVTPDDMKALRSFAPRRKPYAALLATAHPRAAYRDLGPVGETGRGRTLGATATATIPAIRCIAIAGPSRARRHHRDRLERAASQHARVRETRARIAGGGDSLIRIRVARKCVPK
jgi:nicotinamide mononucleotide (NMN) deamidase PncC